MEEKMKNVLKLFLMTTIGIAFLISGLPNVFAQETKSDEFTLEEITVTAQKREMNVQKTPVSIQAVTSEQLAEEAKTRLDEIMQGVVGVASQGSQVGTDFYMRGIGTGNFGPPTGGLDQPAVAVIIDGVYQNRGEVVRGGTLDMQRVEIMRGTQSTTLGGSSLAGAVSLVSNNPVFKYEGNGTLELGNYHLVDIQGVVNIPLVADKQALRIAYSTDKRDGYLASGAGDSDLTNARIKYRLQATDNLNILATFNHQNIGGNGVNVGMLTYNGYWQGYDKFKDPSYPLHTCSGSGCYDVAMGYPQILGHLSGVKYDKRDNPWDDGYPADLWPNSPFRHTNIDQYSAEIHWDLGLGNMTITPSYQQAHFTSTEQPRGSNWRSEDRLQKTKQLDMQLASPSDSSLVWLGGVYYYDTRFSGTILTTEYATTSGGRGATDYNGSETFSWSSTNPNIQTTYAGYGNLTYPVLDTLRIDAGLRYTHDKKSTVSSTGGQNGVTGTATGPSSPFTYGAASEATWKAVTYRVGAEYDVTEQAMAYALYQTGYQPGTFAQGSTTGKQALEQYTAGIKSRWFDKKLQANLEGFQSTYHNRPLDGGLSYFMPGYGSAQCGQQAGPPDPNADPFDYNAVTNAACFSSGQGVTVPKMDSKGADLTISWVVTETDKLDASAEYLHSIQKTPALPAKADLTYLKSKMPADVATALYNGVVAAANSYEGLTLQNSPKWSANASYSHIFTLPGGSTLTPKVNLEYKGEYWSMGGGPGADIKNHAKATQAAYTLWNAYLTWNSADGQFNVNAYVKNIQNKPILTNLGNETGFIDYNTVTLAPPRTFGVVFSASF
jgi:iron complex outermembrane recepter protein